MSQFADRISVSSWSLHRRLGPVWHYLPGGGESVDVQKPYGEGQTDLLKLPEELKAHGIGQLEICSFHLPSLTQSYFDELVAALSQSGIGLQTLLIEAGDPSHPETGEADVRFMAEWVERAEVLGATHARVIAGKQKPEDAALDRAAKNLSWLSGQVQDLNVKLVTENWFALLDNGDHTNRLLKAISPSIGLNGDLGNWSAPAKYDELAKIMGGAVLCHAKADFVNGQLDKDDFGRCIQLSEAAGYQGPYTLIFDSDDLPEWDGIMIEKEFVTGLIS